MEYPPILRQMMTTGRLTQAGLAKRLRVTQPTVSRWLKGSTPEHDQHERIVSEARRLGVLGADEPVEAEAPINGAESGTGVIRLVGYVGAGAKAHFYEISQGDMDEVPAPVGATADTVAVEIRGDSLGALLDRWLAYYDQVERPITPDLIGRLCVVGLAGGLVLVKEVRNGSKPGRFRLVSERGAPIEDAVIEWAAPVKSMMPR